MILISLISPLINFSHYSNTAEVLMKVFIVTLQSSRITKINMLGWDDFVFQTCWNVVIVFEEKLKNNSDMFIQFMLDTSSISTQDEQPDLHWQLFQK
jgi:hypothetical protein